MGHVVRCLALADELRDIHSCNITFAMRKSELGIDKVRRTYPVLVPEVIDGKFIYEKWLIECIEKTKSGILIFDVRDGFKREQVRRIKERTNVKIVTIDDPEEKRLESDLAFYPPVPQVKRISWDRYNGQLFVGWDWVILRKEFYQYRESIKRKKTPKTKDPRYSAGQAKYKILVTMGGSDPAGLIFKVIDALKMVVVEFIATIVIGPGFEKKELLHCQIDTMQNKFIIVENPDSMAQLMGVSDLAIASFGVTAYELAAMGIPAIYLCLTEDHEESASAFVVAGMAISLGVYTNVTEKMVANEINSILNVNSLRSIMADNASKHINGSGGTRIGHQIKERFIIEYEQNKIGAK